MSPNQKPQVTLQQLSQPCSNRYHIRQGHCGGPRFVGSVRVDVLYDMSDQVNMTFNQTLPFGTTLT